MIKDNIKKQIIDAMKARDELRKSTLKMLLSALQYAEIAKQGDLTEDEELNVVRKEAKQRKDAIDAYEKAKANDRAQKEKDELEILKEFLPEELSEEVLTRMVDEAIKETGASSLADIGKVIGTVMKKANGQADGKKVAEMVKSKLSLKK